MVFLPLKNKRARDDKRLDSANLSYQEKAIFDGISGRVEIFLPSPALEGKIDVYPELPMITGFTAV